MDKGIQMGITEAQSGWDWKWPLEIAWPISLIQQSQLTGTMARYFLNISSSGHSTTFPGMDAYF